MSSKVKSFRSDMGRVRGLGSAKQGVHHWIGMRLASVALIPLGLWFVISMMGLLGADQADVIAWVKNPIQSLMLLLFLAFGLYHSVHGIQEVVEDYVHSHVAKTIILILNKFVHVVAGAAAFYAVILMALKG